MTTETSASSCDPRPDARADPRADPRIDPRIRRTRELLQRSLATLLITREFEDLSIQDITAVATVNRATFYAHYPDKFALLECLVAGRFDALLAARGVVFDGTCTKAVLGLILGVCDMLAEGWMPSAGLDGERRRLMEPHVETAIVAVVRQMLLEGIRKHPPVTIIAPELLAATASGAIYGAARQWVQTPYRPSSEHVAETIFRLVAPILIG